MIVEESRLTAKISENDPAVIETFSTILGSLRYHRRLPKISKKEPKIFRTGKGEAQSLDV